MDQKNLFAEHPQRESLFLNRDALLPHYTPEHLLFREKQINEVVDSLAVILKNQKPDNVFLYGKTGTGKTATGRLVVEHLQEAVKGNNGKFANAYMNCRTYNSKYKVISKTVKEFFPEENFLGYSATFVFEKLVEFVNKTGNHTVITLDEIDMIKDLDELVYSLTRVNDELTAGSISILGISNKLNFKDKLDPRTKSSLCKHELVFPPYNAQELTDILRQRVTLALKPDTVQDSAIHLAAALAAKESGDARTAVLLLLKGAELADKNKYKQITDLEVKNAKSFVEEEIIYDMISSLPQQEQWVLYAIARLTLEEKDQQAVLNKGKEEKVLHSGSVFDRYRVLMKKIEEQPITSRWFRYYLNELEMYGLISSSMSGKGHRGQTRLIKLNSNAHKIIKLIDEQNQD